MNLKVVVILIGALSGAVFCPFLVKGVDTFPKVVDIDTKGNTRGIVASDRCSYVEVNEYGPHHVICSDKRFSPIALEVHTSRIRPETMYRNYLGKLPASTRIALNGQVSTAPTLIFCEGEACQR